jgi:hypothetical protein
MATTLRNTLRDQITGYATMVNQKLDEGWTGHLMGFMFNQLRGGIRTMNHRMQIQIENVYASLITRMHRRPHASNIVHPVLIACPDFPVAKTEKKSLSEVITNDGLHYHGVILVPPGSSRLRVSLQQHFTDNQSHYLRDQILNRIDVRPIDRNIEHLTDYALKGLKTNRLPGNETLLILPKTYREISTRPYRGNPEDQ